jgi:hypothetical protein
MSGKPSADFEKAWALFLAGEKPHRASLLAGIHPTTFYRSKRYKSHKTGLIQVKASFRKD